MVGSVGNAGDPYRPTDAGPKPILVLGDSMPPMTYTPPTIVIEAKSKALVDKAFQQYMDADVKRLKREENMEHERQLWKERRKEFRKLSKIR